jgi:hypothetical protein
MVMAGKGDEYRPVDRKKYERGYDMIDWGRKNQKKSKIETRGGPEIISLHVDLAQGEDRSSHVTYDQLGRTAGILREKQANG